MKKWDYYAERINLSVLIETLDRLGSMGWELVQYSPEGLAILKRETHYEADSAQEG